MYVYIHMTEICRLGLSGEPYISCYSIIHNMCLMCIYIYIYMLYIYIYMYVYIYIYIYIYVYTY